MTQETAFWDYIDPSHPLSRYIFMVCAIFAALLFLRYLSFAMQWTIEKTLKQKEHKGGWLLLMAEQRLISNIFFAFSMVVLSIAGSFILGESYPKVTSLIIRILDSGVIVAVMLVINSFLSSVSRKYATGLKLPVKGLIQAVKVVFWIITSILVMSVLINKQPMYLFGGLTALSAVLLLVFKDSILGLTSGFQLLVNDLVRVGDWIEVPGQRADGEIVDILITTVRVRNWDNTIVNVPAYNLIANSFVNWRGMSEAGARRIKRAMNIDLTTIRFLEKQDIEKLKEIQLIKDYLENKEKELAAYNADKGESVFNSRRLTNLGTFRAYCFEYLKSNPKIAKNFTCMVRQLEPTTEGVPLEVYAFSADTAWVNYENIQSDIFDHLFAVAKVFDLKIYQRYAVK